jgi:fermentation-respiration switch protein FrsA (DUF1100 family)
VSLQALPQLPEVRAVWSEGAFARLRVPVAHEFRLVPGWLRDRLVRAYDLLGWLDCKLWVPEINPVQALSAVRVPIYFCHGREDELVPLSEAEILYDSYAGPKDHWWVDNASHYNVRQRNPEDYLLRLRSFLMQHLEATSANATPRSHPLRAMGPCGPLG